MSNTHKFAEQELRILSQSSTDPENRPVIEEFIPEILALVEKFGNSGQSGGSAPFTAQALSQAVEKLCLQKPICPITGIDEEWVDVSGFGGDKNTTYQNSRCSALFKNSDNRAYYLDAIIWKTQKGHTYSGSAYLPNGDKIRSRQFVRDFPFDPKTFVVEINDVDLGNYEYKFIIDDESQLEKVFEYYLPLPITRKVLLEKIIFFYK